MFEDFGKSNLVGLLALGLVSAALPRLIPATRPGLRTAAKFVFDLLTESEAEAAEELMQALVSSTIAEIRREMARPQDPGEAREAVEQTVARFKNRARQRAHRWGSDHHDRQRRYHRHLTKLQQAVDRSKEQESGWRRDVLDDLGESIEEQS